MQPSWIGWVGMIEQLTGLIKCLTVLLEYIDLILAYQTFRKVVYISCMGMCPLLATPLHRSVTVWLLMENAQWTRSYNYVTGFGKSCIVYTSDFEHLGIYKNHKEWYIDSKLSGVIK